MTRLRRIDAVKTEFAEAVERHLDDVHAFLVYLTGGRAVAEDLTAETFARALERWRRFDPRRGSRRAWRCQIARARPLSRRGPPPPARGPLRRRRAARGRRAGVRGRAVPGAGAGARAALGGRAGGRRSTCRARAGRRGRGPRARDQHDGVLDAV